MAKGRTCKPYQMEFTVKELRDKLYRKYKYPQEIDGIVFNDDTEKKLSESSWFRCLTTEQQIIVEKQMRLRANGEFNKEILHYEDSLNESALGISKPTMTRMVESLEAKDLQFILALTPYIHINDGMLRNKDRKLLTVESISEITHIPMMHVRAKLELFDSKRIIFVVKGSNVQARNKDDVYLSFAKRLDPPLRLQLERQKPYIIYFNPYIIFFGQYIDKYVVPFFVNSGWYTINPYAERIAEWIDHNCLSQK